MEEKVKLFIPEKPERNDLAIVVGAFRVTKFNGRRFSFYSGMQNSDFFRDPTRGTAKKELTDFLGIIDHFAAHTITAEKEIRKQYRSFTDQNLPQDFSRLLAIATMSDFYLNFLSSYSDNVAVGNLEFILDSILSKEKFEDIFADAVGYRVRRDLDYYSKNMSLVKQGPSFAFSYLSSFLRQLHRAAQTRLESKYGDLLSKIEVMLNNQVMSLGGGDLDTAEEVSSKSVEVYSPKESYDDSDSIYEGIRPVGLDEQIKRLKGFANMVLAYDPKTKRNPLKGEVLRGFRPRVILYGPPGTGKSMLIYLTHRYMRDAAAAMNKPYSFVEISNLDKSSYINRSAQNIAAKLKKVKEGDAIYLVWIEEIDKVFFDGRRTDDEERKVAAEFAKFFESAFQSDRGNYLLIGTTNYIDRIPQAILSRVATIEVGYLKRLEDLMDLAKQFLGFYIDAGLVEEKSLENFLSGLVGRVSGRDLAVLASNVESEIFSAANQILETPEEVYQFVNNNREILIPTLSETLEKYFASLQSKESWEI